MKVLKRGIFGLFCALLVFSSQESLALSKTSKVYLVTSTYGVMAGTLTGIASLAFYSDPKSHMRNVAMGASIGLYVGILLGTYMVYMVPDGASKSKSKAAPALDPDNPLNLPEQEDDDQSFHQLVEPPLLQPLLAYDPQTQTGMLGVHYRF